MARSVDQVRSFLAAAGVLDKTKHTETCVVVIPSPRVKSGIVLQMLSQNKLSFRNLGHGTGKVRDKFGIERKVRGLLVLAVPNNHVRCLELFAKLSGVHVVRIRRDTSK